VQDSTLAISTVIDRINHIASAITESVERQHIASQRISENVEQA
jgi:hypothetical protein